MKEHGSKIPKEDKEKIEVSLKALQETLKDEKAESSKLKEQTEALIQSSMKLGEIMYKEAQEKAEKDKASNEKKAGEKTKDKKGKKDSKVVDADFEDVTENKKADSKKDDKKSA